MCKKMPFSYTNKKKKDSYRGRGGGNPHPPPRSLRSLACPPPPPWRGMPDMPLGSSNCKTLKKLFLYLTYLKYTQKQGKWPKKNHTLHKIFEEITVLVENSPIKSKFMRVMANQVKTNLAIFVIAVANVLPGTIFANLLLYTAVNAEINCE